MGKRNAAAAIVDSDRLQQFETSPKRMKHASLAVVSPVAVEPPASPNVSASEFTLSKEFVDGTKLMDLTLKQWRIGKPIGKGSFGEIFLASDDIDTPVTSENAKYVVKIEPHSNGPLFVEIHCLLNTAKRSETCHIPPGMPEYIASGSHIFKDERYRFLILKRYQRDLHSIIKNKRVNPKSIPVIACQILDVLEHLHDQGYVHSDIKAENLMIGAVESGVQKAERLSNGGGDHRRTNGVVATSTTAVLDEKPTGVKRGRKPVPSAVMNGVGTAGGEMKWVQENGLYHHQEQEMCTRTRNLRPLKTVTYRDLSDDDDRSKEKDVGRSRYAFGRPRRGRKRNDDASFSCSISPRRSTTTNGYEELRAATEEAHWNELKRTSLPADDHHTPPEDRIHLIDFGLASKFVDSTGQHRQFCMDQRRAHDGTLEFTSRDAHMGAHARRSDLECLGYNLVYWSRGFLPWKDEKLLNQPECVHHMKEYFMRDVRQMLQLIYGEDCPVYLGEFLEYVGNLTYDERPDYQYCKSLFCKELKSLGCPVAAVNRGQPLRLDVDALVQHSVPLTAQNEAEITNKINHVKSLMKVGGTLFPFRESTLHSKASSPKNLRSKRSDLIGRNSSVATGGTTVTDGVSSPAVTAALHGAAGGTAQPVASTIANRKKEKQFSCEEIFATDADQIARDRVEKEYERAEQMEETVIRYTGKPTYAIREMLERKSRGHSLGGGLEYTECEGYIKGYTKPMMDILRKRQSQLFRQIQEMNMCMTAATTTTTTIAPSSSADRNGRREKAKAMKEPSKKRGATRVEVETPMDQHEEEEEEENEAVKVSKYERDDDYEQDEESIDEDEEVVSKDQDDEEIEDEEEEEEDGEEEEEEEEEDEEDDDEEEEEEEEEMIQSGYGAKGGATYRRKKESKARKKEDTDSDFINDAGCEDEEEEEEEKDEDAAEGNDADGDYETDHNLEPDEEEQDKEEEEDDEDDDQQDSDFNDQESSTATESEASALVPVKQKARGRGRPVGSGKRIAKTGKHANRTISGGVKQAGKSKTTAIGATITSRHDNVIVSRSGKHHRSAYRRKKHRNVSVVDDGEGDNAQLFEGQLTERHHHREEATVVQPRHHHHHYNNNNHCNSKAYYGDVDDSSHDMPPPAHAANGTEGLDTSKYRYVKRRKSGLRERIRPTDRGNDYADNMQRKRKAALRNKQRRQSAAYLHGEVPSSALEDDCSSSSSTSSRSSVSSSSRASHSSTSHSVASSSCNRALQSHHSSSVASLASSSISSARKRGSGSGRNPRKAATVSSTTVSSRDSSRTRVRRKQTAQQSAGRDWSRSNSNSSHSTSRSSSVSAPANGGGGEYTDGGLHHHHHSQRLARLPEQQEDYRLPQEDEDDDGEDTRDVDFSPISTRRRRKASSAPSVQGTEATHNGALSRKTKRDYLKGGNGKGTGLGSSSSTAASTGTGAGVPYLPGYGGASIPRRLEIIPPPPPPPVAYVAQQHQQQRGRRPQHNLAYQNYYHRVNGQHHLPSTMLVRTYSRG